MKTTSHHLRSVAAMLLATAALTGCGKSNPVAPEVEPAAEAPPQQMNVVVYLDKVKCLATGDIVGKGEFKLKATVRFNGESRSTSKSADLGKDDTVSLSATYGWTVPVEDARRVQVDFEATEWDRNIIGELVADEDMDNATVVRAHSLSGTATKNYTHTLGTDRCKVRLYYTVRSRVL